MNTALCCVDLKAFNLIPLGPLRVITLDLPATWDRFDEWKVKVAQTCPTLCDPVDCSPWNSTGRNTKVGSCSLLQAIFPTQGLNPGLSHCRWILHQLNYQGRPRILEWVAYPSPVDLPNPGMELGSPALQVDSLPTELPGKPWRGGKGNHDVGEISGKFKVTVKSKVIVTR